MSIIEITRDLTGQDVRVRLSSTHLMLDVNGQEELRVERQVMCPGESIRDVLAEQTVC